LKTSLLAHRDILRRPSVGRAHLAAFWGVVIPLIVIILAQFGFVIPQAPAKLLHLIQDLAGIALLIGTLMAMVVLIRQRATSARELHQLLDQDEPPLKLLGMLARQVRILIQVSELRASRMTEAEIIKRLKLHPYVVEKGTAQARNFTMEQLEKAHALLVETDWRIKTGEMEDVLALDMLVVALARL